jgi:hypothetical protein
MAVNEELLSFIRDALLKGQTRAQIEDVLLRAGWAPEQVKSALSGYADIEYPIPVPRPRPYLSAKQAFMYLVLFTTLYIFSFNLGKLFFQFIDLAFPDPAALPRVVAAIPANIRMATASIIVAFPLFLYVSRLVNRAIRKDPNERNSTIRKWLTYLTLFVAAGVLIGDVIALVYNFLGGEFTIRFTLQVLTIGVIAGPIFGYYLWDLRFEEKKVEA